MGDHSRVPFDYDVFLSHSSKDKPVVRAVAERLRNSGLTVWFDEWEIQLGDPIYSKVREGLERSRILILFMSRNGFGSDWATLEHQTILFTDPLNRKRRFIPLRLDDGDIPVVLRQFKHLDWRAPTDDAYQSLLRACLPVVRPTESTTPDSSSGPSKSKPKRPSGRKRPPIRSPRRTLLSHEDRVETVAVTADGRRAVSGSVDNTLRVWDLDTGACTAVLEGHQGEVMGVTVTTDGRRAVSGSADRTVRVWDLDTGACTAVFARHGGAVAGVAVTTDGRRAVSGSADRTLRVWDLDTGACTAVLEGHQGEVTGVAVTVDGRRAVSGSFDNTLRVWDLDTGACTAVLEGHQGEVTGVAVTVDGRRAVSASLTGRCGCGTSTPAPAPPSSKGMRARSGAWR